MSGHGTHMSGSCTASPPFAIRARAAGAMALSQTAPSETQAPPAPSKVRGMPPRANGERAATAKVQRLVRDGTSSGTPHQDLMGTITPSDRHFERLHGGVPEIDPASYSLLIHGMVDRPTPDGTGVPTGRGMSADGATTYAAKCAPCHGPTGKEGPNDVLVGRLPAEGFPFSQDPTLPHTIGNYWPHATTVVDYVRRAMPPTAPGSLTDEEVYALTAFLLHANAVIPADAVMDRNTLPKVVMPARKYFIPDTRKQSAGKPRP